MVFLTGFVGGHVLRELLPRLRGWRPGPVDAALARAVEWYRDRAPTS